MHRRRPMDRRRTQGWKSESNRRVEPSEPVPEWLVSASDNDPSGTVSMVPFVGINAPLASLQSLHFHPAAAAAAAAAIAG